MVARLVPGIWEQDEETPDAGTRQRFDDVARIVFVEADVGDVLYIQPGEKLGRAGNIRFRTDQPDLGMRVRLPQQMLAAAIADF